MKLAELISRYELDKKLTEHQLRALEQDLNNLIKTEAVKLVVNMGKTIGGSK